MSSATPTALLRSWRDGDRASLDRLMPLVYDELSHIARGALSAERGDHTLQTRALVHEAYLRLVDGDVAFADRAHFLALAARTMRRVLTDHARGRKRVKRGADPRRVELADDIVATPDRPTPQLAIDALDLDRALNDLAQQDPRKAELVELLFFGGLTYDEAAEALGISRASVARDVQLAKAWMARALSL
jgi:RNA polymerase sigma factor (TIGR02999 family)